VGECGEEKCEKAEKNHEAEDVAEDRQEAGRRIFFGGQP
jgi:hypothetical protein